MKYSFKKLAQLSLCFCIAAACKKSPAAPGGDNGGGGNNNPPPDSSVVTPQDPEVAKTIGFFLNDWAAKSFTAPAFEDGAVPASASDTVVVDASTVLTKIPTNLFGNNANIWMGQYVTEPVLLNHITNLHPKIIRFPAGSLSDMYFWNADKDAKPADAPTYLLDANGNKTTAGYWYGKNAESWTCSVDNYYAMRQQTGNEGMITVNYAYARYGTSADPVAAAAHLAADWVRYDNGRTKYWEIGNENYGDWEANYRIDIAQNKDGQPAIQTGELYGKHYKVFADSMRKAAQDVGATIYIGSQLVEHAPQGWETVTTKTWNAGVLTQAGSATDFYIMHNYYTPYNTNSSAIDILNTAATSTQQMTDYVSQSITTANAPVKPFALTEYNIFATGSKQMVSQVAGMHAIMVLGELMKHQYGEASRWDLANGWDSGNDMGLFSLADDPDATKWTPRPAFYYLYFMQKMLGDRYVGSTTKGSADVVSYASTFTSGQLQVTLVNKSTTDKNVALSFKNFYAGNKMYWYTLQGGDNNAEFSRKVLVNGQGPTGVSGGPDNYTALKPYAANAAGGVKITVPARGVVFMVIDKK